MAPLSCMALLITHDIADFVRLHQQCLAAGKGHAGIAVSNMVAPGTIIRRVLRLYESVSPAETRDQLIFLAKFAD